MTNRQLIRRGEGGPHGNAVGSRRPGARRLSARGGKSPHSRLSDTGVALAGSGFDTVRLRCRAQQLRSWSQRSGQVVLALSVRVARRVPREAPLTPSKTRPRPGSGGRGPRVQDEVENDDCEHEEDGASRNGAG